MATDIAYPSMWRSYAGLPMVARRELRTAEREALQAEMRRCRRQALWILLPAPIFTVGGISLLMSMEGLEQGASPQIAFWIALILGSIGVFLAFIVPSGLMVLVATSLLLNRKLHRSLQTDSVEVYEGAWKRPLWLEIWLGNGAGSLLVRRGLVKRDQGSRLALEVLSGSRLLWAIDGRRATRRVTLPPDPFSQTLQTKLHGRSATLRTLKPRERRELSEHLHWFKWFKRWKSALAWNAALSILVLMVLFISLIGSLPLKAFLPAIVVSLAINLPQALFHVQKLRHDLKIGDVAQLRGTVIATWLTLNELNAITGQSAELGTKLLKELTNELKERKADNGAALLEKEIAVEYLPASLTLWSFNGEPAIWRQTQP